MCSGPTLCNIPCATVVFPEPEPPAMPIVSGDEISGMDELYLLLSAGDVYDGYFLEKDLIEKDDYCLVNLAK